MNSDLTLSLDDSSRIEKKYAERHLDLAKKTDWIFAYLLIAEWIAAIAFALILSPQVWAGSYSQPHIHLYAAFFLGGLLAVLPLVLVVLDPGAPLNRMIVSISQILFSVLFIHLSGGRIETHFHIFGSLAFLAFYRDWRPVAIATGITALDHLLRGSLYPQSVYGTLTSTPWRALEHAAWVIFEDIILIKSIQIGTQELRAICRSQVQLENIISSIEEKVVQRTAELKSSQSLVLQQQASIVQTSKMASLGEMSAGIAHEINNPLAIIVGSLELILKYKDNPDKIPPKVETMQKSCDRIARIVTGLRKFSRTGGKSQFTPHRLSALASEALVLTEAKAKRFDTQVTLECNTQAAIECDEVEIEQVLVNLINNSIDALKERPEKWVKISIFELGPDVALRVTDAGRGIPERVRNKLFEPFFTTKKVGEGTGLGLSITKGILEEHGATITVVSDLPNTCFEIKFKRRMEVENAA